MICNLSQPYSQEKHKRRTSEFDLKRIEEVLKILKKYQNVETLCLDLISEIKKYKSKKDF